MRRMIAHDPDLSSTDSAYYKNTDSAYFTPFLIASIGF